MTTPILYVVLISDGPKEEFFPNNIYSSLEEAEVEKKYWVRVARGFKYKVKSEVMSYPWELRIKGTYPVIGSKLYIVVSEADDYKDWKWTFHDIYPSRKEAEDAILAYALEHPYEEGGKWHIYEYTFLDNFDAYNKLYVNGYLNEEPIVSTKLIDRILPFLEEKAKAYASAAYASADKCDNIADAINLDVPDPRASIIFKLGKKSECIDADSLLSFWEMKQDEPIMSTEAFHWGPPCQKKLAPEMSFCNKYWKLPLTIGTFWINQESKNRIVKGYKRGVHVWELSDRGPFLDLGQYEPASDINEAKALEQIAKLAKSLHYYGAKIVV